MSKRIIRFFLVLVVMFFAPQGEGRSYADDVTRALKKCFLTLIKKPGSFLPVFSYYVKKALKRYTFSVKNILVWVVPTVTAVLFAVALSVLGKCVPALEIKADGDVIGYVESENSFFEAKDRVMEILSSSDEKISLPQLQYSYAFVFKNSLTDIVALSENLLAHIETDMVSACAVYIDGSLTGVLYSENEARSVFDSLLAGKKGNSENYVVSFAENIEYVTGLYPEASIVTRKEFVDILVKGKGEEFTYTVKDGDSFESIAKAYSMSVDEILALNEQYSSETSLEEGAELTLMRYSTMLTYKEVKSEVTGRTIPYEKTEIMSGALYSGSTRVLSPGKNGYAQVTSLVTYIGGIKVSSSEVMSLTVTEAVPERIQVGTKPLDEAYTNSNGNAMFIWPIVGAYGINSDYGYRWGKLHAGIDLGMGNAAGTSLGKPVVAVAPGVVTVAAVHSSYGYYVIIDHGGGMQTLYAHCYENSLMVVPGQTVVAGQPIAKVGSTGYSTGPHLHFEVRINGNRVDPKPYLGITY